MWAVNYDFVTIFRALFALEPCAELTFKSILATKVQLFAELTFKSILATKEHLTGFHSQL